MIAWVPRRQAKGYLTATDAGILDQCAYRYALDRDERLGDLRQLPGSHVAIGNAVHALAETISVGSFDNVPPAEVREAVARWWASAIELERARLQSHARYGEVPVPEKWPFYAKKRSAALRRATTRMAARVKARAAGTIGEDGAGPAVEVELRCSDPPLRGRPDRVERYDARVVVVDLKTGIPSEGGVSRLYRVQLLFYAALVRCSTGEIVDEVAIEWIDGSREVIAVDQREVNALMEHLEELLRRIADENASDLVDLAVPSPDNCRFCPYTAICSRFDGAERDEWGYEEPTALGIVSDLQRLSDSSVLVVSSPSAVDGSPSQRRILGLPADATVAVGDRVVIAGLSRVIGSDDLRSTWMTRICQLHRENN